jgi:hypothetical protein
VVSTRDHTPGRTHAPAPPPAAPKEVTEQEVTERAEVVDDQVIAAQMYWVGMLNPSPYFVPRVRGYHLTDHDLERLEHCSVSPAVHHQLMQLPAKERKATDREAFLRLLDQRLSPPPSYTDRFMVLQHAKKVLSMDHTNWQSRRLAQLGWWLVVFGAALGLALWRVDVNLFSLHAVYGNRLVRCYLGASRPVVTAAATAGDGPRRPDPVTGFDPDDDLRLARLQIPEQGGYDGPYLLVNTALNLVHGERLDWQQRKAEAFVLTPRYCGSEDTHYRLTAPAGPDDPAGYAGNLRLGEAMTLSGAAASPNMGYHSSAAVTALLTVFNARLGAWLGNPRRDACWQSASPSLGFFYLLEELFGWTGSDGRYVYLSDGGHFENLGAYELVRRRCRYVIVSDAGEDGEHQFEDMGNLIHKCRVDLGIDIEIDLDALRRNDAGRCRWHCAVGRIRYDGKDEGAAPGILLYLKPSLTGDEPADVLHYARRHSDFPHESTVNQFYNESQFESYRALGQHVAGEVFRQAKTEAQEELAQDGPPEQATHGRRCRALFDAVVRRWFAMPPDYEATFVHATDHLIAVQEALRTDARLRQLTLDLYPELAPDQRALDKMPSETPAQAEDRRRAELHVIAQMLQVMENAWLSLNLDAHYAHPLNRGWMGVFHRWTNAATVRARWPLLRAELARGFVNFCEKQMLVGEVAARVVRLDPSEFFPPGLTRLCDELQNQWPGRRAWVENLIESASTGNHSAGWLVYPAGTKPRW